MGNIVLALPTVSDRAVITAGSEAATMPASNLLRRQPSDMWRALDLDNAFVTLDLGAAEPVRLVWLGYTNASSAATWRVRAAATEADLTAAPGYDSGSLSHWPVAELSDWDRTHAFLWLPAAETWRWWRIDVDDPANPDGFYQAGRLYLSDPWQPSRNYRFGASDGYQDDSQPQRARGGQTYVADGAMWREGSFSLRFQGREEMRSQASRIDRLVGTRRDLLIVYDPEDLSRFMDECFYARLAELRPLVLERWRLYEKTYTWTEWELP